MNRLALIVALLTGIAGAQGSTTVPEGITGSVSTSGTPLTAIANVIIAGSSKYPTIATAISGCPGAPTSCHIYVSAGTYVSTGFTLGVAPCQQNFAQLMELDPAAHIKLSGKITLPCGGNINGINRDGSFISATAGFPVNASLVDMGDGTNLIDARFEGILLNCASIPGCTGIRARGLNENSKIARNYISSFSVDGIKIDGTTVNTANFFVEDNQFGPLPGITGNDITVINSGAITFQRNSLVSALLQHGAGISFSGTINTVQFPNTIYYAHCEEQTDCIKVDGSSNVIALGVSSSNGTVNTVHVLKTATGQVQLTGPMNNGCNAAKLIVRNDLTGTLITSLQPNGVIPNYEWQFDALSESWTDSNGFHPRRRAFANLGTPANGTQLFCTDCNSTCTAGGSTGRTCFRENGAWVH